jgi:hypothetical protein
MLTPTQFYGNWRAKVPNILRERAGDFFKFQKRCQLFVSVHNEALTVATMRVSNEDGSAFGINCCDAAPTPTGFTEIVQRWQPSRKLGAILGGLLPVARDPHPASRSAHPVARHPNSGLPRAARPNSRIPTHSSSRSNASNHLSRHISVLAIRAGSRREP